MPSTISRFGSNEFAASKRRKAASKRVGWSSLSVGSDVMRAPQSDLFIPSQKQMSKGSLFRLVHRRWSVLGRGADSLVRAIPCSVLEQDGQRSPRAEVEVQASKLAVSAQEWSAGLRPGAI